MKNPEVFLAAGDLIEIDTFLYEMCDEYYLISNLVLAAISDDENSDTYYLISRWNYEGNDYLEWHFADPQT